MEKNNEAPLGKGSHSSVFKRSDPQGPVAVKCINTLPHEVKFKEHVDQLCKEYSCLVVLAHSNIISVFPSTPEDGQFSMELFDIDLKEFLLHQHPTSAERLSYLEQICLGLEHVHKSGFVHLDVKPENILLKQGRAVLTDFGFVSARTPDAEIAGSLYIGQDSIGTPYFMGPERFLHPRLLHPASDVWSLALTAYILLGRKQPWAHIKRLSSFQRELLNDTLIPQLKQPLHCSDALWKALKNCWIKDFKERVDVSYLLKTLAAPVDTQIPESIKE